MQQVLTGAAFVAALGFPTTIETGLRPDARAIASEVAHGLIRGIILGSNVWAYSSGLVPAHIESRVTASGYALAPATDRYSVAAE
ncbi:MAG TPA: hypothetical protein VKP67_06315 [Xanthobacteraceae bacterium]|nr:hypothetical protein [Xanthobacteraceae bacterium]